MTKIQACQFCDRHSKQLGWIANVFLVGGGRNCALTLKALVKLVSAGHEVAPLSFKMPYEGLLVDGVARSPEWIREAAKGIKV